MNKEDILRHIPLFENISQESRAALADICIPKTVKKKEPLFWEGDKGLTIYILVKGHIRLFKTTSEGKEAVIKVVKPGEMFAEVVLFEQSRYPVSAVALRESLVFMISKHQFTCLLENESFRNDFIGNVMKKLRYLTDQIQFLTTHDVEDRLFMFLEEQYGKKERIVSSLSKKDVAAAIGATPETLSRLLQRLKNEGKVDWTGSDLHINWNTL
jgi:CRP/FNR family transcriptional regulator